MPARRLETLPDEIGELPALLRLNVSTNMLRALPASMGRLRKVQRINAANNMLVRARGGDQACLHLAISSIAVLAGRHAHAAPACMQTRCARMRIPPRPACRRPWAT